ncbi:TATA box binding protein associated factor-domain-containing protein [Vararia minispora EC-137]|uniref:TATA box binding protein associated factor-domain-containing protein n=1 Tax=Vararia minispora EC-137 TaxID=1314806 RepID=A0ACB8QM55_9AGAM|nr:TATA box binding protein associated factor-domain-containing protein [Vararia minispora EC-137]
MPTGKQKAAKASASGLYKAESVKDVAESLNIPSLPDHIASALASDVEYRIYQVVEEAARFMRHARRTTMTTADVDNALRVLNIEPLYGHSGHNNPTFRRALPFSHLPSSGTVYFVEDEEIDFDRVLKEEKLQLPPGVRWTAHWLAVEGVQPLVPENPPAVPREDTAGPSTRTNGAGVPVRAQQQNALVKQVLSRELQLYYSRLTAALLPPAPDPAKRSAALASLRNDAGLQALLPYIVRWVGEGVVGALKEGAQSDVDGRTLEVLLDVIAALLDNASLFVEPYLHQLLPPILSVLLHSTLPYAHSARLRRHAAATLSRILTQYSTTYPSLAPRIMKTLLLALLSPDKARGTRDGAVRGLVGVGKDAVRRGLVDAGGARVVGEDLMPGEDGGLGDAVVDALRTLCPQSARPMPVDAGSELDARLREVMGEYFADRLAGDRDWAAAILGEA